MSVHINVIKQIIIFYVINKGYFSYAFLFKPLGGLCPPSGLRAMPTERFKQKAEEISFILLVVWFSALSTSVQSVLLIN